MKEKSFKPKAETSNSNNGESLDRNVQLVQVSPAKTQLD